ncbi:MAG: retropepsin-like domain-containing protein [Phycisphaeraceae bacterium]|nr:retropepsin-like domain-containing protein [Phycisphaeraceae bacterium]
MKNALAFQFAFALVMSCGLATSPAPATADEPAHIEKDADGVPIQGAVTFDANASASLEVKRIKSGHILVRPMINGHDAGWFIFDTGAGICCISTPQINGLELESNGSIQANGVGGAKPADLYKARTMKLGAVTFQDHPLMSIDLAFLEPLVGEKISGVIGYGVLSKCIAEIDLVGPSIALHDPATYSLAQGQWTPLDIKDRIPTVPGSFEGHEGLFRLDLGATGSVTFHQPAVAKYDMLKNREVKDCKLGGFGGFVSGKRGKVASLELGGVKFEDVNADFALEAKGTFAESTRDANIGTDILGRFIIITDYPHQRIGLIPKQETKNASAEQASTK